MLLLCPHCRHKFELEQAFQEVDGRKYVELLTGLPPTLVRPVHNYIQLHTPAKQALTWTKALNQLKELAPLIKEGAITRNKVTYSVPVSVWLSALTYLTDTPPATLTLPLKNNGYLLTVLVAQAEKAVTDKEEQAAQAKQAEKDYANRKVAETVRSVGNAHTATEPAKPKEAPINPEWRKQFLGMMHNATNAPPLTDEQKAEQAKKLAVLKAQAKQKEAELSPEQQARLAQQRAERRAFDESINQSQS